MRNMTKIMASVALLTALPATMTAMQLGTQTQRHQAPQYMVSTVLASLGVTTDHNVHSAGCGCAACQQGCQVVDPSTV